MNDPIKHVVLLMLENASCDRYLGYLSQGVYPDFDGVKPGDPSRVNLDWRNQEHRQAETKLKQMRLDPIHEQRNVLKQIDGMKGFVRDLEEAYPDEEPAKIAECLDNVMGYYPRGALSAHHALAESFRPCDRWFCSVPGPTWPNRFFALSGTSNGFVVMPESGNFLNTCSMVFLELQPTILTRLQEKGRNYRVFYHDYPCSLILLRHLDNVILRNYSKMDEFYQAAKGNAADFPEFTFIEPKYYGNDQNDDHPPHNVMKAQKLVADVYNALRANEQLWQSTLLVVVHDEHGGFYDHVSPPVGAVPPQAKPLGKEYAFDQLGVRVPAILVSPYTKKGVAHSQFDHTSLLKYLKDKWELGDLGLRVDAATSIATELDLASPPRTDCPRSIPTPNAEELVSPYPELETETNPHHYALDLFKKIAVHSFAIGALQELTKRHEKFDSWGKFWTLLRTSLWPVARAFLIEFLKDYTTSSAELDAVNKARRDQSLDRLIQEAKVSSVEPRRP